MYDGSNARALEDAFFRKMNAELLAKQRAEAERREGLQALREASGVSDEKLLAHMLEHNLRPETLCAFRLVPMIAVIWADGAMHPDERKALMRVVEKEGIRKDSAAHAMVEKWVAEPPPANFLTLWAAYVRELRSTLSAEDFASLRTGVLHQARAVAEAAGGFLGIGRVSAEEAEVLRTLEAAFEPGEA